MLLFPSTNFLLSVANLRQLPEDKGQEVAFIGRSNVGKSSAINSITGQNGLARTSKTPGRTQLLNFFQITQQQRLVDLPGYGYAKVAGFVRDQWQRLLNQYLTSRHSLRGLILLIDSRHPLKATDHSMLNWSIHHRLSVHILLTKADKLSRSLACQTLQQWQAYLSRAVIPATCQLFSTTQRIGLEAARHQVLKWLS